MENTKLPSNAGQQLSTEQVAGVAGGTDTTCSTTVSAGTDGVTIQETATDPSTALIAIYEGFVDVTSHIIERVMGN